MPLKIYRDPSGVDEQPTRATAGEADEHVEPSSAAHLVSWEIHKENIQPISQGRKIDTLMRALTLVEESGGIASRKQMLKSRKERFEEELAANEASASKQLDLWCEYIDWLEQNVPDGGKVNGITNAIEGCIEFYYDKREFKQDKRLFSIFMKFKRFCDEPVEVFGFMYANSICTLLARFYLNWSWQFEIRGNMKRAEDLLKLGLRNLATPRVVLEEALEQLKCRLTRMIRSGELDDCLDNCRSATSSSSQSQAELASGGIRAALQTLKFKADKKLGAQVSVNRVGAAVVSDQNNVGGLKSQTSLINGVRVPKRAPKKAASRSSSASGSSAPANKPVQVFSEAPAKDENAEQSADKLAHLMRKVATSQRIQSVGRTGAENVAHTLGSIGAPTSGSLMGPPSGKPASSLGKALASSRSSSNRLTLSRR